MERLYICMRKKIIPAASDSFVAKEEEEREGKNRKKIRGREGRGREVVWQ